jgi:hypothetical protein
MKFNPIILALVVAGACLFCRPAEKMKEEEQIPYPKGTFGYDLQFLKSRDSGIIVLSAGDAQAIVSPKYQGKVFTSTASGPSGPGFGWINYEAVASDSIAPHMNAYGGEDRLWLGPEGGQFSIFFSPGADMTFENWQTPPGLDIEPWTLMSSDAFSVSMRKVLQLENYSGARLDATIDREVRLLSMRDSERILGIAIDPDLKWVGFESENTLTNTGSERWTKETGTLCVWILGMLKPSDRTTVVIPYVQGDGDDLGRIATTDYFGEIPPGRFKAEDGLIYFKADGKYRSKIGLSKKRATSVAGSYDAESGVLTVVQFDKPAKSAEYINQLWEIQEDPFAGDVINSYNDGPIEDGTQMGPFYELETSSPAAFLSPGESLTHRQRMFHFQGTREQLNRISQKVLGVGIEHIESAFTPDRVS